VDAEVNALGYELTFRMKEYRDRTRQIDRDAVDWAAEILIQRRDTHLAVMGGKPRRFKSPDRPVEQVSWEDVQGFMQRINERISGLDLVLPSEA
jgi:formylglycine-generating enzyme required for sulfatase activity